MDKTTRETNDNGLATDRQQIKSILRQMAKNLATCAATIDAFETYAKEVGWDSKKLLFLHEEAKQHLEIVFHPLFDMIEKLEE